MKHKVKLTQQVKDLETKAVIFARVSTTEQEQDGQSIESQVVKLREYCKKNNLEIIKEFEIVESSTKGHRPKFLEMLDFVKSQKGKIALIIDKVDRLQRSILDVPKIDALVSTNKVSLHFLDIGRLDNDSNASQKAFYRMAVVFANAYTDAISENVKRTNDQKRKEGTILGPAPIGYLNMPRSASQKRAVVGFDPERSHIVKKIFEEYSTGLYSMDDVRKNATDRGLRSLKSNKKLGKSQIEKILSNPFYYGYMVSKGHIYQHVYETLIDQHLFDQCQDVRLGRKTVKYKRTMKSYTYRGLIKCYYCGCSYSPEPQKEKYIYMRPTKSQGDCEHCVYVKEEVITAQLSPIIPTPMLELIKECLKTVVHTQHDYKMQELKALGIKEQKLAQKLENALDHLISNSITKEEYDPMVTKIKTERLEITHRMEELHKISDDFENQVITVFELANHSYDLFKSSEIDDKRKIVNLLFPNLFLDGQKLVFTLQKPFDKLIEMTSRPLWLPGRDSNPRPID
jgi:site-specific DNA recombinase